MPLKGGKELTAPLDPMECPEWCHWFTIISSVSTCFANMISNIPIHAGYIALSLFPQWRNSDSRKQSDLICLNQWVTEACFNEDVKKSSQWRCEEIFNEDFIPEYFSVPHLTHSIHTVILETADNAMLSCFKSQSSRMDHCYELHHALPIKFLCWSPNPNLVILGYSTLKRG